MGSYDNSDQDAKKKERRALLFLCQDVKTELHAPLLNRGFIHTDIILVASLLGQFQ